MYQKDLKAAALKSACTDAVESCVHWAGVDLNTASSSLLQHVGGVGPKTAEAIVRSRESTKPFQSRADLLARKLLRPKLYEQAAGFLRVTGAGSPALDATEVHPNDYGVATQLLKAAGLPTDTLEFGEGAAAARQSAFDALLPQLLSAAVPASSDAEHGQTEIRMVQIPSSDSGASTSTSVPVAEVRQIVEALCRSFADPRESAPPPVFRQDVLSLSDVRVGMELTGVVRNEVDFGWFVDCGLGEDGLLHTSAVNSAGCAPPSIGDVVAVTATSVDVGRRRLGLSLQQHHAPPYNDASGSSHLEKSGGGFVRDRNDDDDKPTHSDRPMKRFRGAASNGGGGGASRGGGGRGRSIRGSGVQGRGGGRARGPRRGAAARAGTRGGVQHSRGRSQRA